MTGERVLVAVDERSDAALLAAAAALARALDAPWTALCIETPRYRRLSEGARDRVAETLRRAAALGGDPVTIPGSSEAAEILAFARDNGMTQLMLGQPTARHRLERLGFSLAGRLAARSAGLAVHIVPAADAAAPRATPAATRPARRRFDAWGLLASLALAALATAIGVALRTALEPLALGLIYLAVITASAIRFGLVISLLTSVVCTLAFDFFFLPPLYELNIADPRDSVALACFVAVAFVTSNLSATTRAQMLAARQRARTTAELYSFSRSLGGIAELPALLATVAEQIAAMLRAKVAILTGGTSDFAPRATAPGDWQLTSDEQEGARRARDGEAAGDGGGPMLFLKLETARGISGVLAVAREPAVTPEERRLLGALADQAAVAIERITLAAEIDAARLLRETERLRQALLTSVSHALRTPLATVLGALAGLADEVHDANAQELVVTAQDEAERLDRFVRNLLDITRIEAGTLQPQLEPTDIADVVGSAIHRAQRLLARHRLEISLPNDLPMPSLDFVLIEQVVFHLLDNAARFSAAGSTIAIHGAASDTAVELELADEGVGIPPGELDAVFDKFRRLVASDRQRAGTGLGLAICRGFLAAQGGTIVAANRTGRRGAVFTLRLPLVASAADPSSRGDSPHPAP
jgi:two-component system sensor histidine kinase KdpD